MRPVFWQFDSIRIDLDDRDVSVRIVHSKTLASVVVELRLNESVLDTSVSGLRERVEHLVRESVLDLASFFESP